MDEVFGEENFVSLIAFTKTGGFASDFFTGVFDFLLQYGKDRARTKFRKLYTDKSAARSGLGNYGIAEDSNGNTRSITATEKANPTLIPEGSRLFGLHSLTSGGGTTLDQPYVFRGIEYNLKSRDNWKASYPVGMDRLNKAGRMGGTLRRIGYKRYFDDFPFVELTNMWTDTRGEMDMRYVVQTTERIVERCILSATDPGDLVLDPTCGAGTTAYVAEQWGRRWITIDTSRVALALARARIMGARYPYYLLADSRDGQLKESEISRRAPSDMPVYGNLRQGFVYERVPHITLRAIANNAEIDVIYDEFQEKLEPLREELNRALGTTWEEWEIPREAEKSWSGEVKTLHQEWWDLRITRQKEIDASIAAKADYEYLYDKPYEDRGKVRVAGPFTVESISPHRVLGVDENGDVIDGIAEPRNGYSTGYDFGQIILDNLRRSGVQQAHKEDRITFTSLTPWPGRFVCAEGRYVEGGQPDNDDAPDGPEKRAGIFVGPEFGTVSRPDLVEAAREAAECGFDVLIACAFNYDAHTTEFESLGRIPVLKARMNADLHMADELKNTGNGNLFVIFGEPDISVASEEWLVDSLGKRVAPYDIFKLVSGTDSLAEINGLDSENLHTYAALSCRGEIWDYLADAEGGSIHTGQHRRGPSEAHDGGISPVAWRCAGISGGTRNLSDLIGKAGSDAERGFRDLVERLRRDQQNAQRTNAITIHSPLTTLHLSQVTVHGVDVSTPTLARFAATARRASPAGS